MNEQQLEIATRMEELEAVIPQVKESGDPEMMKNVQEQYMQLRSAAEQSGMDPDRAVDGLNQVRQEEQQQLMLGEANKQGRMQGHEDGMKRGMQQGMEQGRNAGIQEEIDRRNNVTVNASRNIVERMMTENQQSEAQKEIQQQQAQQQQPQQLGNQRG